MLFEFGFFSSLLLVFFFHGLVYAGLLLKRGVQNSVAADKWLALFLLLCCLYITPWMVGFAGWYNQQPYRDILFYVPFQHLFLFGPVIFFYVQSLLNPTFTFGKKEWLHLLPSILYMVFCGVMVVTDKLVLKDYYFLANGEDPDFDRWYQFSGLASTIFYFFITLRYYNLYRKMVVQVISYADTVLFRWIKNFLTAFLSMQLIRAAFFLLTLFFPVLETYMGVWWFFLLFSVISYYIAITGYANQVETRVPFRINLMNQRQVQLLGYPSPGQHNAPVTEYAELIEMEQEQQPKDSGSTIAEWKQKLLYLMETEKLYENPELSLSEVAKKLQSNASFVSRMINQGFSLNFNDFVNSYRVQAVVTKLKAGEQRQQTLLGIAYDCGFNSKATFNRAFKKFTGKNPRDFMG